MKRYVVLEKKVGQTPLECAEAWREAQPPAYKNVPLSYAGRLDPMASGKLLILIGDECKRQTEYHGLDKRYVFQVLCGVHSDTGDVLGMVERGGPAERGFAPLRRAASHFLGTVTLPYPHFSSKTVQGKPLHVWTLENKLDEITIPTKTSRVYSLQLETIETLPLQHIHDIALERINSIAPVTDPKKALGRDFRRTEVRDAWKQLLKGHENNLHTIATFSCIAGSGTYMRTLAEEIAKAAGTTGLAYSIHRTHIGRWQPLFGKLGFWRTTF